MAPTSEDILAGFQINWMILRDLDTAEILWHGNEDYSECEKELVIKVPKKVLVSRAISREMNFSSIEAWDKLKLVQTVLYKGVIMEEMYFEYGPVTGNCKHTWRSMVEAAPEVKLMTADILSGNVVIATKFFNEDSLVTTSKMRLFYV
uniref:GMP phosphodiesterase delta subunit domain-containing protein n=1 Tax=Graphocephala atropunctata TaxID=36148 RepID=A0A1B6MCR8_9HEMI